MSDNNKPSKSLFLSDDDNSEDIALIQEISNKLRDPSISKDETKDALSKLNEFRSKKIQPYFDKDKDIAAIRYGGWQFGNGNLGDGVDIDKLEPIYERLPTQKKQPLISKLIKEEPSKKEPLIIEPIKEEKSEPSTQEGFRFPNRNKVMKMEGEEETAPSNSILDKLLKKERESSPDVQVPRQVWNPDLGTFESSKDTVAKRPFSDLLFGSPEMRAAEKAEQYSSLMRDEEERAKQVDSSGRRMISKSPLLESYEKLLQIKPEEVRQISSVSEAPVRDGSPVVPEIKSVKEQKSSPVSKSSVSTGVEEDDSPESKLNEAIKAESEKPKQPEMDFNEMLRMAQEARDKGVLLGNIGKAAETFATGLTGTVKGGIVTKPVGTDFYDKLIKQAEQPVEDVGTAYTMKTKQDEMQRLARRRDSNSDESKFARDLLAQQGIKVPEAATAEALEKYAPQLTNILNQREAREARAASARERALDRESLKQSKLDEKQMDFAFKASEKIRGDKYFKEFNDLKINRDLVVDAINNPSPQKDNVIIYNFIKALDPGSAVKEGEIKFTQAARSWPLKIKTAFNKAYKGDILDPKERKEILDFMNQRVDLTRKAFATSSSGLLNQLKDKKIDLKYVPGMEEISGELESSSKSTSSKKQIGLPKKYLPGSRVTTKQGTFIVDSSGDTATEE
jgi:hypothetical protein